MRKLRLALLGIVSIFCLNSCITSALIGTAVALCGENGCNNIRETKDKEFGIKIYEEKEPNRFKEYINSLNLRKRHKLEIQKGLSVNVPDGFILKNQEIMLGFLKLWTKCKKITHIKVSK